MKIYNIQNGKEFFERIAKCTGPVELISESGEHLRLTPGKENCNLLPMTCFQFQIEQMDLKLENPKDFVNIISYLSSGCCC